LTGRAARGENSVSLANKSGARGKRVSARRRFLVYPQMEDWRLHDGGA